jgi:zinc transporter ZupT
MTTTPARTRSLPLWLSTLLPLAALGLMLALFAFGDPLAAFRAHLPPVESLSVERARVTANGFELTVVNGGPDPVTVAQVSVDDAYWQFTARPSATIPRLGRAFISLDYPWVEGEPNVIRLVSSTGLTFDAVVPLAVATPTPGWAEFLRYGLVGIYVGIIPVALGLLWYPAMRRLGRRGLGAVLALTIGLLVFLLVDTLVEGLDEAAGLPGVFQGVALLLFAALLTWLVLLAVAGRRPSAAGEKPAGLYLASLIALGIGLHNLGEGMAIGAAFALGEAALGSFLVLGFTLHNVTEGVGIAAPLTSGEPGEVTPPPFRTFVGLALLAGAPAIVGTWIGGFAFSPILAVLFLGVGAGAIWQVIVDVGRLLQSYARRDGVSLAAWPNVLGFAFGLAIMYLTALLVKV